MACCAVAHRSIVDHVPPGTWHALKFVSRNAYGKDEREKNILMWLQSRPHQNIVDLIAVFEPSLPSRPHCVLVFAEAAMDCRAFLHKHRECMTHDMATMMAGQVLSGIDHLHTFFIVHRDLKPDNVLVHLEGGLAASQGHPALTVRLKIADFSRARIVKVKKRISKKKPPLVQAMMSTGVCTRNYCAPELIWHGQAGPDGEDLVLCDSSIDVWSFGCVAFEFYVGEIFAAGTTLVEIAAKLHLRLGAWPEDCLPSEASEAVLRIASSTSVRECPLLQTHPWLSNSLRWCPTERLSTNQLSKLQLVSGVPAASQGPTDTVRAAAEVVPQSTDGAAPTPVSSLLVTPRAMETPFISMKCK